MRLADPRPRGARGAALTPMIDVVFLLLIFFILVARFGPEEALGLTLGQGGAALSGPPRLIDVGASDLRLNGRAVEAGALGAALDGLGLAAGDVVVLRTAPGVELQRIVAVMDLLRAAGHEAIAVTEGAR